MTARAALGIVGALALAAAVSAPAAGAGPTRPARSARTPATAAPPVADTLGARRQVVAYYFHGKARCTNCVRIETWSQEAIQRAFARELADGRLAWQVVDVEAKGNEHFVEDYQLYTKSLVLVERVGGKQVRWRNLARVWELLVSRERFQAYVRGEVAAWLKDGP